MKITNKLKQDRDMQKIFLGDLSKTSTGHRLDMHFDGFTIPYNRLERGYALPGVKGCIGVSGGISGRVVSEAEARELIIKFSDIAYREA